MRYLFIGGAPRSGTSALTELLSSHADLAIGMERYKHLYSQDKVGPELFEERPFFDFSAEQTNFTDCDGPFTEHYARLKRKFTSCSVVGDKYPHLFRHMAGLDARFRGQAKFVVLIRNIHDVASSFNVRAMNESDTVWPAKNDFVRAVDLWNESLACVLAALKSGLPLFVVGYESLFDADISDTRAERRAMLRFIGVEDSSDIDDHHVAMRSAYARNIKPKARTLKNGQEPYIEQRARFDLLRRIDSQTPWRVSERTAQAT